MARKIDPTNIHFDEDTVVELADLDKETHYVGGERLTEDNAERMVAEVLAKAQTAGLRPGGKSLSGGTKHSPVVQVRVSETTRDKLAAIARTRRMSVSKLSRQVLDDFVAREAGV
jgi:phenylpyruvate tautomerase PptA (4-oxalocrotonate tautomerase family)